VEGCQCYTTCLQIGDNEEVMYLAAKSTEKRTAWMQAFRKGIIVTPCTANTNFSKLLG